MPPESGPSDPLRRAWSGPAWTDTPTPTCLDDDTLGALAEGRLDQPARLAVLPHLAECARCRAAVASLARALADPQIAREIGATDKSRSRRPRWLAASAAVAAALLILLISPEPFRNPPPESHRSPAVAPSDVLPTALAPVGNVAQVKELRWARVPSADRYRVTLFHPSGHVLYEATPADSIIVLPDSVVVASGIRYLWKVEARVDFNRWVSSNLVGFTLVEGTRP